MKCLGDPRIDNRPSRPPLQNSSEEITAPYDATQIDLVPKIFPSGGYGNALTSMDVFSRYFYAYPTFSQDAKTISQVAINILFKHAYLLMTVLPDKGSALVSHVIEEVADILGIMLQHATTKRVQTIRMLELTHTSLKQALNFETGERMSM